MNNYGYYRPGLPFVVKNLIIINAIVFVVTLFAQQFMYQTFSLFYFTSPFFKPFQLITYMFMHGGFWHIFFNMFSLYMFGSVLENYWGGKKFFLFYQKLPKQFLCKLQGREQAKKKTCNFLNLNHQLFLVTLKFHCNLL